MTVNALSATTLEVRPRQLLRKKVRFLRRAGIVPANLYGAGLTSQALQIETQTLRRVLATTSRNTPVQLQIRGDGAPRTAFIWRVQRHPVTEELLHVDFYFVETTRRMRATVPLVLEGVDPNLEKLDRRVIQYLPSVEVESFPQDLPTEIRVDASALKELEDEIKVRQLVVGERVDLLTDLDLLVARIGAIIERVEEEVKEEAPAEALEAAAAEGEPAASEEETKE